MANMVRWNLQELGSNIQSLNAERERLAQERNQMQIQNARVDANWQSADGRQYQSRLAEDMQVMDSIIAELARRIEQLQRVFGIYQNAENSVRAALPRLPR